MQPIVQADNLTVRYRDKTAVAGLHFALAPGEVLGIAGPNGSGKTTTLACLEGLQRPSGGTVRVFGGDPAVNRRQIYRYLGVQLQDTDYPPRIHVGELCALFASFFDRPADWRSMLTALGLAPLMRRSVRSLSGGERQKLSVLLALMGRPQLLILDELSTGLDPESRQAVRTFLRDAAAGGLAMILVTHYLNELEDLADRILLLNNGRQRYLGTLLGFRCWAQAEAGGPAAFSLEDAYLSVAAPAPALPLEKLI
ncbi:MAG: ABC transporter ATP-binding protein [Clostridia bacterium]|nr:ABC transporter ATP-binding protein [Clostridia bacterium]